MKTAKLVGRIATAALLTTAVLVPLSNGVANAASNANKDQCLVRTAGVDESNNLVVESTECFETFAEVIEASGGQKVSKKLTAAKAASQALQLNSVIATHYEFATAGGASISISGTGCTGGGLNVSAAWNDRISSTYSSMCSSIRHYEHANYTGGIWATVNTGLTNAPAAFDNLTTSIRYY